MRQDLRHLGVRFLADLQNKGRWVLKTIHNLVLLFTAGLVMAAVGWLLEGYLGVNPVAPTPLVVVVPSVIIGFGSVYGAVALWSYTHTNTNSRPQVA